MPADAEKAYITYSSLIALTVAPEDVLLHIAHALHYQADGVENDSRNVPSSPKCRLGITRNVGAIENGDWERDSPNPEHLENPEAEEGEELVSFIVEAAVCTCL